jgi:hypothetical protein
MFSFRKKQIVHQMLSQRYQTLRGNFLHHSCNKRRHHMSPDDNKHVVKKLAIDYFEMGK